MPSDPETPDPSDRIAALEHQVARLQQRLEERADAVDQRLSALLAARTCYLGDYTALTFLQTGQRIFVDTRSLDIGVHLLSLGEWQRECTELCARLIRPGQTVLDIGANHGVFTLVAATATGPSGRVLAYEPNPRLAHLARLSAMLNGFGGYTTVDEAAVGERDGTVDLLYDPAWSGSGHADWAGEGSAGRLVAASHAVRLDGVLEGPVQFIKLSAQGSDGLALRGMRGLLERSPDLHLLMEFAPFLLERNGTPAAEVAELLGGLGLRPWLVRGDVSLEETSFDGLLAMPGLHRKVLLARHAPEGA